MIAMLALVLHLGGVGKCVRLIWEWSVHDQNQVIYNNNITTPPEAGISVPYSTKLAQLSLP